MKNRSEKNEMKLTDQFMGEKIPVQSVKKIVNLLEQTADNMIDLLEQMITEDGYLDTFYINKDYDRLDRKNESMVVEKINER